MRISRLILASLLLFGLIYSFWLISYQCGTTNYLNMTVDLEVDVRKLLPKVTDLTTFAPLENPSALETVLTHQTSELSIDGEERARLVWERCKSHRKPAPCPFGLKTINRRLLPVPQHNMLMCSVGKTGTSNWKTLILLIKGIITKEESESMVYPHGQKYFNPKSLGTLGSLQKSDYQLYKNMMTNWYKFTFVRDPLSRYLSGYRDKFTGNSSRRVFSTYQNVRSGLICQTINATLEDITSSEIYFYTKGEMAKNCHSISKNGTDENDMISLGLFTVFLIFSPTDVLHQVVEKNKAYALYELKETRINTHWTNLISLCGHCSEKYKYDFIGTVETMNRDTAFLRDKFGINHQLPSINSTQPGAATSTEVKKMYDELPDILKQYLLKYLQYDAEIFGYSGYNSTVSDEQYPDHRETEDCTILDWK